MKRAKIAAAILLAVAVFTWWVTYRLERTLEGFLAQVEDIEEAIATDGDIAAACKEMETFWYGCKNELTRFISQQRVDDVTAAVTRLLPLSAMEDKAEFVAEVRILRLKIEELWEAYSPSLSSFF